jgi:hypothetical protein
MNQLEPEVISEISSSLEIDLSTKESNDEIRSVLTDRINYLIAHDFNKLIAILYRIDISEKQLKKNLENQARDAGAVIADMIVERQIQKLKSKQQFRPNENTSGEDKW